MKKVAASTSKTEQFCEKTVLDQEQSKKKQFGHPILLEGHYETTNMLKNPGETKTTSGDVLDFILSFMKQRKKTPVKDFLTRKSDLKTIFPTVSKLAQANEAELTTPEENLMKEKFPVKTSLLARLREEGVLSTLEEDELNMMKYRNDDYVLKKKLVNILTTRVGGIHRLQQALREEKNLFTETMDGRMVTQKDIKKVQAEAVLGEPGFEIPRIVNEMLSLHENAALITEEWKCLAIVLDVKQIHISAWSNDILHTKKQLNDVLEEILEQWKCLHVKQATFQNLLNALYKIKWNIIAEYLERTFCVEAAENMTTSKIKQFQETHEAPLEPGVTNSFNSVVKGSDKSKESKENLQGTLASIDEEYNDQFIKKAKQAYREKMDHVFANSSRGFLPDKTFMLMHSVLQDSILEKLQKEMPSTQFDISKVKQELNKLFSKYQEKNGLNRISHNEVAIGINLGTTDCCVAVYRKRMVKHIPCSNGSKTTPSFAKIQADRTTRVLDHMPNYLAYENQESTIYDAKRIGRRFAVNFADMFEDDWKLWPFATIEEFEGCPKIVADGHHSAKEISSMLLKRVKYYAEEFWRTRLTMATITVPAYFTDTQSKATIEAGKLAGLKLKAILIAPTTAAFANSFFISETCRKSLVYDLGGGTFEIADLKMTDDKIKQKQDEAWRFLKLPQPAWENAEPFSDIPLHISLQEMYSAPITVDEVDSMIILKGSRIVMLFHKIIEKHSGKPLIKNMIPDDAVAFGAAVQAAILNANPRAKPFKFGHEVGAMLHGIRNGRKEIMILNKSQIPGMYTYQYKTNQNGHRRNVSQGYQRKGIIADNNAYPDTFQLEGITPSTAKNVTIQVTVQVSPNQNFEVGEKIGYAKQSIAVNQANRSVSQN